MKKMKSLKIYKRYIYRIYVYKRIFEEFFV